MRELLLGGLFHSVAGGVWRSAAVWLLACAGVQSVAGGLAHAGGPPEVLNRITVDPADPARIALAYENAGGGIVFTNDGGQTWSALCTDAMASSGASAERMGPIGLGGDGELFIGLFDNALHDDGKGCGFQIDPQFSGQWTSDFSQDPANPSTLYAVTSTAPEGPNSVHRRVGAGAWEALDAGTDALVSRIRVGALPGGGTRLYESASRLMLNAQEGTATTTFYIRVSDDGGATWTEHAHDLGEITNADRLEVEAVDPTNPDRIVVVHRIDEQQRMGASDEVMVSEDQGATLKPYATLTVFGGVDIAADGRVWIADRGDTLERDRPFGLFYAANLNQAPTKVADSFPVSCVRHLADQDKVFVCSLTSAGIVGPDGSGFTEVFAFGQVPTVVACDGQDLVTSCKTQYEKFWCTAAHFPTAPLCCPYVDPATGMQAGGQHPMGVDCSGPQSAFAGRVADAPVQEPMTPVMTTTSAGDGGTTTPLTTPPVSNPMTMPVAGMGVATPTVNPTTTDSGGCGCAVPGRARDGGLPALLALFVVTPLLRRRRRR